MSTADREAILFNQQAILAEFGELELRSDEVMRCKRASPQFRPTSLLKSAFAIRSSSSMRA
ncbi:hypothetical protein LFL96_35505 (plasmid) [Paraburkholderia sp. D15]|uniref:hypothetical protein n=1 Tax=Paraburkholderia sp. D15 TaxID=2880218 RepID=UPI00247AE0D8|nr:hypothetical protein [Paraburkholderia sp. D15]WGS55239.1 hypothetical protein LFL96_35505 [Paraburkholderia sp. D15]